MPALLERPKMTRAMYEALKRHIMKEREKKKRAEQEQDEINERLERERELRRKKEEADSLTLEETKEQILAFQKKMEQLKAEKHELFSQLKKVLHQEGETKKRKEQNEMTMSQPTYQQHPSISQTQQPMVMHGRPTLYKPVMPGIKRTRSPTPPPSSVSNTPSFHVFPHVTADAKFPHPPSDNKYAHSEAKYSNHEDTKFVPTEQKYLPPAAPFPGKSGTATSHLFPRLAHPPAEYKSSSYQAPGASHLYPPGSQSFQQPVAAASGPYVSSSAQSSSSSTKYPTPQSAFTSYPAHYGQSHTQKSMAESFPTAYSIQRMQQPGYHASLALQQSMEHAAGHAAGFEDKYKSQIRVMVPSQKAAFINQTLQIQQQLQQQQQHQSQLQQQQQHQSKTAGGFVAAYPSRSKAGVPVSSYPASSSSASTYSTQGGPQSRSEYPSQSHGRYY